LPRKPPLRARTHLPCPAHAHACPRHATRAARRAARRPRLDDGRPRSRSPLLSAPPTRAKPCSHVRSPRRPSPGRTVSSLRWPSRTGRAQQRHSAPPRHRASLIAHSGRTSHVRLPGRSCRPRRRTPLHDTCKRPNATNGARRARRPATARPPPPHCLF
jgi:hypothetical protein